MTREEIKTPQDVLEFMKENISYGWIDANGEMHDGDLKNARELYRTMSDETVFKTGKGTCIEMAHVIHTLLNEINVPNKLFCLRVFVPNPEKANDFLVFTHCFVLYTEGDKIYHLEYPDKDRVGIYEYNEEYEALYFLAGYYKNTKHGVATALNLFDELPEGYDAIKINAYMESQGEYENGKYKI
jgi:hypothetical protein